MAQMLGEALGYPNPHDRLPMLQSSMMHGHYSYSRFYKNIILVCRDGRDVVVSFYNHQILANNYSSKLAREKISQVTGFADPEDIRSNLPKFIELAAEGKLYPKFSWSDFYTDWLDRKEVLARVSYEMLLDDAGKELHQIQLKLGGTKTPSECQDIADRFSFEHQAQRKAGVENNTSFLRKGIAGDWKSHFSHESAEVFSHYHGDMLERLGYTTDNSWVSDVT